MAMQELGRTKGFPCKHCGIVCSNMPSLLEHMDSHYQQEEDRKFRCDECGRRYRHAGSLANHKKTHELGSFHCPICARKLSNPLALKSHLRIHTSQKKYSCVDCGKAFRLATQLATHQKVHLSGQSKRRAAGDRPFKCGQCEKSYRHHGSLINHKKSHQVVHSNIPICFKQLNNLAALHSHQRTHNKSESGPDTHSLEVTYAGRAPEQFSPLNRDAPVHFCHLCQVMFPNDDEFQEHIQKHNSSSMSFGHDQGLSEDHHDSYDLKKSSVTENGERRFKCQVCGKSYRHAGSLINHKRSHQTGIYQCSICRKTYPHMAALRSHPLTLENQQACFSSQEGDASNMMTLAQENTNCGETFADIAGIKLHICPLLQPQQEAMSNDYDSNLTFLDTNGQCTMGNPGDHSFAKKQDMLSHQLIHNKAQADDAKHIHMDNSNGTRHKEEADSSICGNCDIFCTSYHHLETHQCTTNGKSESSIGVEKNEMGGSVNQNLNNGDRQYKCDQCGRAYRHAGSLLNHKKSHKTGVFRCMVCQKRFYNLLALKNHQRTHFDVKSKISRGTLETCLHRSNVFCIQDTEATIEPPKISQGEPCQNTGAQQPDSGRGSDSSQISDPRPYSCDQCGRTYRHAGSLVNHKNSHKTGEYYCSVCNNTYSNQLAMKNHLRIHFSVKKHNCQECGKAFRGKKQLSSHICAHLRKDMPGGGSDGQTSMSLKREERPFTCIICNRSYRHAGSLLNHKNTHKSGHFSCTFCSKPFSNPMALRNHTRIHTQKKKHVCLTCGKAFRLASILHNHQKVHTRVANHFSCPECGKTFQGKSGLKRHRCRGGQDDSARASVTNSKLSASCLHSCISWSMSMLHKLKLVKIAKQLLSQGHRIVKLSPPAQIGSCLPTDLISFGYFNKWNTSHFNNATLRMDFNESLCCRCDLCGRSYRHAGSLLNHKKTHSENLHHCTLCLQTFPDLLALQIHSQMKRHCCPDCGKTFCLISHLQNHMEVHSKDRTLVCSPCHQSFPNPASWESGLDQTMELQGIPKLKSHVCEHCGRTYRHAGSLLNHKNSHKTGAFFCSVCQKEFTNLMALKNHRRIHTEPKRYQCLECGKAFRVSTQLICHRRIHTKEKPFSCLLCDKRFSSKSNLRHHQKMHQSGGQDYESSFGMDTNSFMDLDMGSFL
ncbi:unnamed protein product [Oncorhynchus mykiss]|uniref:C2H2-type domain-containing protein n=1 Tax=Oncorhynchus mykiss TaxID=8022 RepID=A0A060X159_ONCMY|nr:unnamed protein product [Oncorhynchus mykiss]